MSANLSMLLALSLPQSASGAIVLFAPPVYALAEKSRPYWWNAVITIAVLVASIFCFVKSSPFIYFNF